MSHSDNSPAGGDWAPYRPTPETPWDRRRSLDPDSVTKGAVSCSRVAIS
jgi:hypothetical protein